MINYLRRWIFYCRARKERVIFFSDLDVIWAPSPSAISKISWVTSWASKERQKACLGLSITMQEFFPLLFALTDNFLAVFWAAAWAFFSTFACCSIFLCNTRSFFFSSCCRFLISLSTFFCSFHRQFGGPTIRCIRQLSERIVGFRCEYYVELVSLATRSIRWQGLANWWIWQNSWAPVSFWYYVLFVLFGWNGYNSYNFTNTYYGSYRYVWSFIYILHKLYNI